MKRRSLAAVALSAAIVGGFWLKPSGEVAHDLRADETPPGVVPSNSALSQDEPAHSRAIPAPKDSIDDASLPALAGFPWSQADEDAEQRLLTHPPKGAQVPGDRDKMSHAVAALAWRGGDDLVDVLVGYDELPASPQLVAMGGRTLRDFPLVGVAHVQLPASSLAALSLDQGVSLLSLDEPVAGASANARKVVNKPKTNSPNFFTPASDVRVAVLDTGVSDHLDVDVRERADCTAGARGATRSIADNFDVRAFDGSNGDDYWVGAWRESGESDGATRGAIEVDRDHGVCLAGRCLQVETRAVGVSASRSFDIEGATQATLSYVMTERAGVGSVAFEISSDGVDFDELVTYHLTNQIRDRAVSFDITPYASANTTIRARALGAADTAYTYAVLGIDNLRVDATVVGEACVQAQQALEAQDGMLRDNFRWTTFAGNSGTLSFASDWVEQGEANGPWSGYLEVDNDYGLCVRGRCLQIETGKVNDAIVRKMNLIGASAASLSFTYSHTDGGVVALEASGDGGHTWSTLATYEMNEAVDDEADSFDLLPFASANTQIRFRVVAAGNQSRFASREGMMGIDNVEVNFVAAQIDGYDELGHGTHVAGIVSAAMTGRNVHSGGIAPGAGVVSVRVLDGEGRGYTSDVIAGLEWVLANAQDHDIRVVNMSLGKAIEESAATDPLVQAVEAIWDSGVVVVASAGNYGRDGNFTITSPGNSPKIITVGSITDHGTGNLKDDTVSTYSSRGPTLIDHYLKPDLLAPGNRVIAPVGRKSRLYVSHPQKQSGTEYLELSGTSMAAGVVSGAVVLMLTKDPSLTPATIKARLMRSARKIDGPLVDTGAGVLDVEAAMNESGVVASDALSPKLGRNEDGSAILIEDTSMLWGHPAWG
ncbi:MAG: S8 family peptidase, partial [Pseudomonadota bacterium]